MAATVVVKTDATAPSVLPECPNSVCCNIYVNQLGSSDPVCDLPQPPGGSLRCYLYLHEPVTGGQRSFTIDSRYFIMNPLKITVYFTYGHTSYFQEAWVADGDSVTVSHYFGSGVTKCESTACGNGTCPSGNVGDTYCEPLSEHMYTCMKDIWGTYWQYSGDCSSGEIYCSARGVLYNPGESYCESDCNLRICQEGGGWAAGGICSGDYCGSGGGNGGNGNGLDNQYLYIGLIGVGILAISYAIIKKYPRR